MSSRVSLTSLGEGASLALVGQPSTNGITIKIPYGVDVLLHQTVSHPIISNWVGLEVCPYSYFWRCGYFRGPSMSFVTTDEFLTGATKITSRISVS